MGTIKPIIYKNINLIMGAHATKSTSLRDFFE